MPRIPALFAAVLLEGCAPAAPTASWWEQRSADGPCWDVDLSDGLDETSTDEIHALYQCVDQGGAFASMEGLDAAMDATSRTGQPLGVEVAYLADGLAGSDLDLFSLAGTAVDLLQSDDKPILPLADVAVELLYGQPYDTVAAGGVSLASPSALNAGVLVPMLPALPAVATAILDDGDAIPALASDALSSDTIDDLVCTEVGLATSTDDDVAALNARLLPDLGAAILTARSPENDRWEGATGDSLRDLVTALLLTTGSDGQTAVTALGQPLTAMLEDDGVRDGLASMLANAQQTGELDQLPLWALHLAQVDSSGTPLCDADTNRDCSVDDSALVVLVRLLAESNEDVQCSALGITLYDGNFADDLLKLIAGLDPTTTNSLTDLAGTLLGWSFTGDILDFVLGACSGIDDPHQLVADLSALDRLNDPDSGELLDVLVNLLGAVYAPDQGIDQLQPFLSLLAVVEDRDLVPPVEEVLRDLANAPLLADLTGLVPLVLDPAPLAVDGCPTGSAPLDWNETWSLLGAVLTKGDRAQAPITTLSPVIRAALGQEGTWTAAGNLAQLLQNRQATLQDLPRLLAELVAVNPDLSLLRGAAGLLSDDTVTEPALRICESDTLLTAVGSTQTTQEGPLPFAARLVTGGTLQTVLQTVDLLLAALAG